MAGGKKRRTSIVDCDCGESNKVPRLDQPSPKCDWSKCMFCQDDRDNAPLTNPQKTTRLNSVKDTYVAIAEDIKLFDEAGRLPMLLQFNISQSVKYLSDFLRHNNGIYHKNCRHRFHKSKLKRYAKDSTTAISTPHTRGKLSASHVKEYCLFCKSSEGELTQVRTLPLSQKVYEEAVLLSDACILRVYAEGDLIAVEAKYHKPCLILFHRRAEDFRLRNTSDHKNKTALADCTQDVVNFIDQQQARTDTNVVFKLSDLYNLLLSKLNSLNLTDVSVHRTRFKEDLLSRVPSLIEYKDGREVLLTFKEGNIISQAATANLDPKDDLVIQKAADIIRAEMKDHTFVSSLNIDHDSIVNSVPHKLVKLVNGILSGQCSLDQGHQNPHTMTISQLIVFNHYNKKRQNSVTNRKHLSKETPIPLYLGVMVFAKTRKKGLVDKLSALGLSISYDRVRDIADETSKRICQFYKETGNVCPPRAVKNSFTTAAIDNIDHNPSSSTSTESFHGTGISLIQHTGQETSTVCPNLFEKDIAPEVKTSLPESYTSIPPLSEVKYSIPLPNVNPDVITYIPKRIVVSEYDWLTNCEIQLMKDEKLNTWSAFNSMQACSTAHRSISFLLPLLNQSIQSSATVRHSFDIVKSALSIINPSQLPVITADQPVYAIAKQIQWLMPSKYGEDKMIMMMGGLHIEMCVLKMLGTWLEGSGWVHALVAAEVASQGKAESFLAGNHVKRCRYVHQVSLCALYHLMLQSWKISGNEEESLGSWLSRRRKESVQFDYWYQAMCLMTLLLTFVQSIRSAKFLLFRETIRQICPWLFALDRTNYARWVPVFLHSLDVLDSMHPAIFKEFMDGHFVSMKTDRVFSCMSDDQLHEQNNKLIKSDGGAVGIFDKESALLNWMVAGPEIASLTESCERTLDLITAIEATCHSEDTPANKRRFTKNVKDVIVQLETFGNPFEEEEDKLITLHTRQVMPKESALSVRKAHTIGEQSFQTYYKQRLNTVETSVHEPIKKNNLAIFQARSSKKPSKTKEHITSLKQDCHLFSRLFISCQNREGDLDEFFEHENHPYPPSLSEFGRLRSCQKSDILYCLPQSTVTEECPDSVQFCVYDGAALIHILPPGGKCKTFGEYASGVFLQYINTQLRKFNRVDIVFDVYIKDSIKSATRNKRGVSTEEFDVKDLTSIPRKQWSSFLKNENNKVQLFCFLSSKVSEMKTPGKLVVCTTGESISTSITDVEHSLESLFPCKHEEADTRMALHLKNGSECHYNSGVTRTVDSDVVIILISQFAALGMEKVFVDFGTGKHRRIISIHSLANSLGSEKCLAISFFHAFTGCDTVSSFAGKGKKIAWSVWAAFDEITDTFKSLANQPSEEDIASHFNNIQRFVCLLYDRATNLSAVNDCRRELFTKKSRLPDNMPPTFEALKQHVKRAVYQAGFVWKLSLTKDPSLPSKSEFGWEEDATPKWSILSELAHASKKLIKCSCSSKGCSKRCNCVKASLPCTLLCACNGQCSRDND